MFTTLGTLFSRAIINLTAISCTLKRASLPGVLSHWGWLYWMRSSSHVAHGNGTNFDQAITDYVTLVDVCHWFQWGSVLWLLGNETSLLNYHQRYIF